MRKDDYVDWNYFWGLIIIATAVIGFMFSLYLAEKTEIQTIRENIAGLKSDVSYIRASVDEVRKIVLSNRDLTYNK